jgi:chemotaxis protein MotB
MPTIKLLFVAGIALFLIFACVPFPQYNKLEAELEASRSGKDEQEGRLKQAEEKIDRMNLELRNCEAAKNQSLKDAADFEAQNTYLRKINQQLLENIARLQNDLHKKNSVIQLQGKVIQLLDDTKKTIETSLKDQIAAQEIEVVEEDDRLKVIFVDKILFDSGSADINGRGMELLQIMAESLKGNRDQNIVVEGHTDNVPLSAALKKRFPSNWELSTARAAAVVRFFQEQAGIEPQRLSARGYSFYRPIAPNTSEAGRHQNRRIEIILGLDK